MKIVTTKLAKLTHKVQPAVGAVAGKTAPAAVNNGGISNGWMTKGSDKIAAQVETVKLSASRKFAPEVMIKDGESKMIRFRANEPIGSIYRYSLKTGGRWTQITAPEEGETDPMREAGMRPSLKVIWEVVDIDGYTDKQGKKQSMLARYLVANVRLQEQLEMIKKKKGDLTKYTIEISRTGKGTQTTYTLLPEAPAPLPGLANIKSIRNDVAQYYSPVTLAEMESIAANYDPSQRD